MRISPFRLAFGAFIGALFSVPIAAAGNIPVAVRHSGPDQIGQEVSSMLEAKISESDDLDLVSASTKRPHLVILVSSANAPTFGRHLVSAVAYVFVSEPEGLYFTGGVLVCGDQKISACSNLIMGELQNTVHR